MKSFKLKSYSTKMDNYHLIHRIDDLKSILDIQCSKGNYDADEYMRGMANGLLLAWHTLMEPYDSTVLFIEADNTFKEN